MRTNNKLQEFLYGFKHLVQSVEAWYYHLFLTKKGTQNHFFFSISTKIFISQYKGESFFVFTPNRGLWS